MGKHLFAIHHVAVEQDITNQELRDRLQDMTTEDFEREAPKLTQDVCTFIGLYSAHKHFGTVSMQNMKDAVVLFNSLYDTETIESQLPTVQAIFTRKTRERVSKSLEAVEVTDETLPAVRADLDVLEDMRTQQQTNRVAANMLIGKVKNETNYTGEQVRMAYQTMYKNDPREFESLLADFIDVHGEKAFHEHPKLGKVVRHKQVATDITEYVRSSYMQWVKIQERIQEQHKEIKVVEAEICKKYGAGSISKLKHVLRLNKEFFEGVNEIMDMLKMDDAIETQQQIEEIK